MKLSEYTKEELKKELESRQLEKENVTIVKIGSCPIDRLEHFTNCIKVIGNPNVELYFGYDNLDVLEEKLKELYLKVSSIQECMPNNEEICWWLVDYLFGAICIQVKGMEREILEAIMDTESYLNMRMSAFGIKS